MRTVVKWLGYSIGALIAVGLLAAGYVYFASERILHRQYEVPLASIDVPAIPTGDGAIEEGIRLARLRGCYDGCHGSEMGGGVLFDEPLVARLFAPGLPRLAAEHSDAELVRAIRHGVRRNGTSTFAMPSAMFHHLSDEDLGAILAVVKRLPAGEGAVEGNRFRFLARLGLVTGRFTPQREQIESLASPPANPGNSGPAARGRYLAMTTCTECHGADLQGGEGTPSLAIVRAYSPEDFMHLMRTGEALGDRDVGLMSRVAESRFRHFTDDEVVALHAYLSSLAGAVQ